METTKRTNDRAWCGSERMSEQAAEFARAARTGELKCADGPVGPSSAVLQCNRRDTRAPSCWLELTRARPMLCERRRVRAARRP